ncbi:hypothetical protein Pmar_PMAR012014 [Perkinsus marinus ATCC 50983]|uniref:Uncharacterized protein n=1 Tax=Perkinsus marinus (strain ATCC 50983 / TXsc) TaxID=423536 RepID=C5LW69_PERM5|nr:hypothetical protein Pmar_PMAR012014 [Perkinsus marinus ATCC 50983]EEQ99006.1 hypothetical protein Pmar_PMAR012014 [Perkinsus marinus ATCC 50983]|eukprot:XP_002766289.1 hypothetical protein Pmar_PMAR012014 [Perkinsus marinus ATCC 50983]
MIQYLILLTIAVPALGGQLSASSFTPEVHCGLAHGVSALVVISNGDHPGEVADIMCAVLTDKKPNYLVLSRVKASPRGVVADRKTSFCAMRLGKDGIFRASSTDCDPMRMSKAFNFTYIHTLFPGSTIDVYNGSLDVISLSRPAPIGMPDAAVFVGDDDELRVSKIAPQGPWYLQRGDAFFPIPIECAPKKKEKLGLFKKLTRSRPVNMDRAKARCDPGADRWLTMNLDGDVYHLLFGSTFGSKLAVVPFILVAKRRGETTLIFKLLEPVVRMKLESALKPFEDFHSAQIKK